MDTQFITSTETISLANKYKEFNKLFIELPEMISSNGENYAYSEFNKMLNFFSRIRESFSEERDREEMMEFRMACLPRILQSKFAYHVFSKPRGFPGDYITQQMIWDSRKRQHENLYQGISEIGRSLNALTLRTENCRANIERYQILKDHLAKYNSGRIASIGSGCGIEFWESDPTAYENVVLLDQDVGALNSAQQNIVTWSHCNNFVFLNNNVLKFILNEQNLYQLGKRHLIYAFGLFDYFNLAHSAKLIKKLWQCVIPGGEILVSNAHPSNPTRFWMEYGGDWFLNYKTEDELKSLADGLPDVESVHLKKDSFCIYQYLRIKKS